MTIRRSPMISSITWGEIQLEGFRRRFKDVKLYPGGAAEWDWKATGTHHEPGIQPADVEELLEHGAEVVVLSTGFQDRLCVCPETLQMLEQESVLVHVVDTESAVQLYNELRSSRSVAALIHSTC